MPSTLVSRTRRAARGVRKTHRAAKSFIPAVTAAVGLLGALAVAMDGLGEERREARARKPHPAAPAAAEDDDEEGDEDEDEDAFDRRSHHYSPLAHAIILLEYAIKALGLMLAVGVLAALALFWQPVGAAVLLTMLFGVILWTSERLSRQA